MLTVRPISRQEAEAKAAPIEAASSGGYSDGPREVSENYHWQAVNGPFDRDNIELTGC